MLSEATAATLVFFGSALWFRKDDPRHAGLLALEEDLRRPVIVERTTFDLSALGVYRLLGQVCIVLGLVLGACVVLPSGPVSPSIINLVAGIFLLALGGVLLYVSREKRG
jgi:Na+/H+ antiporter NhaD/arsenite permease-like protein